MQKIGRLLALVLICAPSIASAQSTDVQAQIAALIAQIQALQSAMSTLNGGGQATSVQTGPTQMPPTIGTTSSGVPIIPSCPAFTRTIQYDSRGGDVANLQVYLKAYPAIYPEGLVTGYFGVATEKAVQRWQSEHGVVSSGDRYSTGFGVVGPKTASAMRAACENPASTNPGTTNPVNPNPGVAPTITLTSGGVGVPSFRIVSVTTAAITLSVNNIPASNLELLGVNGTVYKTLSIGNGGTGTIILPVPGSVTPGMYKINIVGGSIGILQSSPFGIGLATQPPIVIIPGNPAMALPTCTVIASPQYTSVGSSITLSWSSTNATQMSGLGGAGAWPPSGQQTILISSGGQKTFNLTFKGLGGEKQCSATVTATVGTVASTTPNPTQPAKIEVSAPTSTAPGATMRITWTSTNAPADSVVRLELMDKTSGFVVADGAIATDQAPNGSTDWRIPIATDSCTSGSVCGKNINTTHTFQVIAKLYKPSGACFGNCTIGSTAPSVSATGQSNVFSIAPPNGMSASIDASSLVSSSTRPYLFGLAYGVSSVSVTVSNGAGIAFTQQNIPVSNSLWSVRTGWLASSTNYTVFVYAPSTALLTQGTLSVGSNLPWGHVTVSTNAITYAENAPMTVSWNNQGNVSPKDWLTYVPGKSTTNIASWTGNAPRVYTGGARTGSVQITAPAVGATYQIVMYANDSFTEIWRSGIFSTGNIEWGTMPQSSLCSQWWKNMFGERWPDGVLYCTP